MTPDQIFRSMFIRSAMPVTPSDTKDLPHPGVIFIDQNGTEGDVKVDLIEGGTVVLSLIKCATIPFIVKRVYSTNTTAASIYVSPIMPVK